MKVIRSVAFEESDANWTRTISLVSSTTADDISKTISLQTPHVRGQEQRPIDKSQRKEAVESVPLKRQRSRGDWSDTGVRIGGKGNGQDRVGVDDKGAGHIDWGGGGRPR